MCTAWQRTAFAMAHKYIPQCRQQVLDGDACVSSVLALSGNGGRLIDTARLFGNEDAVGAATAMKRPSAPSTNRCAL